MGRLVAGGQLLSGRLVGGGQLLSGRLDGWRRKRECKGYSRYFAT